MKLVYYKSEKGLFIGNQGRAYSGCRVDAPAIGSYRFNGKAATETHHAGWLFLADETELTTVERYQKGTRVNFRWELVDSANTKLGIPAVISQEDSCEGDPYNNYDYCIGEKCEHYSVRHLYSREYDTAPNSWEPAVDVDVEVDYSGEIKSAWADNPVTDTFTVFKDGQYPHKGEKELDLKAIANYAELERMLVPDLLIHNRPCSIPSETAYNIIRHHVKQNTDPMWAEITSDYNFCFTVQKKIAIKPYVRKTEIKKKNGHSYSKPRFNTRHIDHKKVKVFEMTHKKSNYTDYTPIEGFRGDNLQDLANNIKLYLAELMEYVNLPLARCEACEGTGHVFVGEAPKQEAT